MRLRILLILLILPYYLYAQTQQTIQGKVVDAERQAVVGATVRCLDAAGKLLAGTVTDGSGRFVCTISVPNSQYRLLVTFIGLQNRELNFIGSNRQIDLKEIVMQPAENKLETVTVTASQSVRKEDKLMIYPSKEQIRHSYDGYSALASMMIPHLDVDALAHTVSSRGEKTLLCINGRECKLEEVRALNPKDILRVDFYDGYHPEYPTAASVIDYILVVHDHGGTGSVSANEHLNHINGDDFANLRFYHKKSEFSLFVSGEYTHFTEEKSGVSETRLHFPDQTITQCLTDLPASTHANGLSTTLFYLYQGKKDVFSLSVNLRNDHRAKNKYSIQQFSNETASQEVSDRTHSDRLTPALQLYYKRNFNQGRLLRVNLYGSYNNTTLDRDYLAAYGGQTERAYLSTTKEDFYFFNPDILYVMPVKKHTLTGSFIGVLKRTDNTYTENQNGTDNQLTYGQAIISIGDSYRIPNRLFVSLTLRDRLVYIDNGQHTTFRHYLTPSFFARLTLPHGHYLRLTSNWGVFDPAVSEYNGSEQRLDQYQVLVGNPNLRTGGSYQGSFAYEKEWKCVSVENFFCLDHVQNNVYSDVTYDDQRRLFVHSFENGGGYDRFLYNMAWIFKLVPGRLKWVVYGEFCYEKEEDWEAVTKKKFYVGTELNFMYKAFNAKLQWCSPTKRVSGGYITEATFPLSLDIGYSHKNWHFTLDTRNPFFSTAIKKRYQHDYYESYSRSFRPLSQDNVLVLGVNYRFDFGKRHSFQNIQMDNQQHTGILTSKQTKEEE